MSYLDNENHVRIQRGGGVRVPPPGISQVIWVSIEISIWNPHPPGFKLDPSLENVGPPLDPWKSIVFSVIKLLDRSVNCKII